MTECSTNMIAIARCLSLSGKGNLSGIITIPPPSVKGRRTARTSKLISLSLCSAFLSQEYDLLPCKSPLTRLCVFLYLMGCLFVHLVLVCFFGNTSLAEELLGSVFVYLTGTWRDVAFIKMVSYSG